MAGVVEEVGPGVEGFEPGTARGGGQLRALRRVLLLPARDAEPVRRPAVLERRLRGVRAHPRARGARRTCCPCPTGLAFREAAMVEPLACVIRGVEESWIGRGQSVAVIGTGPIGLMFVALARMRGAHVVAAGRRPRAAGQGAGDGRGGAWSPRARARTSPSCSAQRSPDGRGADVVIEAVGLPETSEAAVRAVRKGGVVQLFGGCPADTRIGIDSQLLHYQELTIKSTFHHTPESVRKAFRLIADGHIDPNAFITAEAPLERPAAGAGAHGPRRRRAEDGDPALKEEGRTTRVRPSVEPAVSVYFLRRPPFLPALRAPARFFPARAFFVASSCAAVLRPAVLRAVFFFATLFLAAFFLAPALFFAAFFLAGLRALRPALRLGAAGAPEPRPVSAGCGDGEGDAGVVPGVQRLRRPGRGVVVHVSTSRSGKALETKSAETMRPPDVRVKHARDSVGNRGRERRLGAHPWEMRPRPGLIEGDVGRKLGQNSAVVAEHVAFARSAALVERNGMQILGGHVPATTDRQDRAPAKRAPRVHADDVCGHEEPPPGQPRLRIRRSVAPSTRWTRTGGERFSPGWLSSPVSQLSHIL